MIVCVDCVLKKEVKFYNRNCIGDIGDITIWGIKYIACPKHYFSSMEGIKYNIKLLCPCR